MIQQLPSRFSMLWLVFFSVALTLFPQHAANSQETGQSPGSIRGAQSSPPTQTLSDEPSSPYWRSFLWEAVPSEWLSDSRREAIVEAYERRDWKPLFITARFEINRGAQKLLTDLGDLESHGMDSKPFHLERLRKGIERLEQGRLALTNVEATPRDTLAVFGGHPSATSDKSSSLEQPAVRTQYASNSPEVILPDLLSRKQKERLYQEAFQAASEVDLLFAEELLRFGQEMDPHSQDEQAQVLEGSLSVNEFLSRVVPDSPQYRSLRAAYAKYRRLAAEHPRQAAVKWASPASGEVSSRVRELQSRLQQEGFYDGKLSGQYDTATHDALKAFQKAHLIEADGKIGNQTRDWLNTGYPQKVALIKASMRALRDSDTRQYTRYLRINIPQFLLQYVKDGRVLDTHRVIVGRASGRKIKVNGQLTGENQTPALTSTVEQVVVNPRWYITDRIWRELAGDIAEDPGFYERNGYFRARGNYAGGSPRMFQEPGPSNPLGQVKFEFRNAYAVFLHDTPKKYLFARSRRDFSHGCVRVENARSLAELILTDDQNSSAPKLKSLFETHKTTYIKLNDPIPIIVEYVPVTGTEDGHLIFCGDPYGQVEYSAPQKS